MGGVGLLLPWTPVITCLVDMILKITKIIAGAMVHPIPHFLYGRLVTFWRDHKDLIETLAPSGLYL